jgi:hypothetical protein
MTNEIEDILDEFDFQRVQTVMKALDWKYWNSDQSPPTIGELRKMSRSLLNRVYHTEDSADYFTACGGFEVTRNMYPGDTKKYMSLKFVATEWNNYD